MHCVLDSSLSFRMTKLSFRSTATFSINRRLMFCKTNKTMRSITRYFLAFLLIAGPAYIFASPKAKAPIQQKTEDRHLSGFHAIEVGGPYDVTLTQGNTESVRVEAPEDVISHVTTEVENGVLKI